jgi:hypothetical protein
MIEEATERAVGPLSDLLEGLRDPVVEGEVVRIRA